MARDGEVLTDTEFNRNHIEHPEARADIGYPIRQMWS